VIKKQKLQSQKFDGQDFMGRKLTVNEARQREDRGGGGYSDRERRRDNW
jgi:hypothetical protein